MSKQQEEIEVLTKKDNKKPGELSLQNAQKEDGTSQAPKRRICSYAEMEDLIGLKKQLVEFLLNWNQIPRSSSDDPSSDKTAKSPASSYVSLNTAATSPQIARLSPPSSLETLTHLDDDLPRRPSSSSSAISRTSISPFFSSTDSSFSRDSTPTPSPEPRRTASDQHSDHIDPKFLETLLYEQLKTDRVTPNIIKDFITALTDYLPSPELIDTFVFPPSKDKENNKNKNKNRYNKILKSLNALESKYPKEQKINCIRIVHEIILTQSSGEGSDNKVFNDLIACVRQMDFLLSTIKEDGDIVYPDSCPDGKSQKMYKEIVTDLRGIVNATGKPDYHKRQAYLTKVLIDSIQCGIFKLIQKKDEFSSLIIKLKSFLDGILKNNLDGKLLSWIATHKNKKDPYLTTYQKELVEIKASLEKALLDYGIPDENDEIAKCLFKTKEEIDNIEYGKHGLDPRTKLAKIYVYIKDAEAKVLNKLVNPEENTHHANKEKYLKALNPLTRINLPQECCVPTTNIPSNSEPTSNPVDSKVEKLPKSLVADNPPSSASNKENIEGTDRVENITAVHQKNQLMEKSKTTAPTNPTIAVVAEQTSHLLTEYVNKDKGFFGFFKRSSSTDRLNVANGLRRNISAVICGGSEQPDKMKYELNQLDQFINELNQKVCDLSKIKRDGTTEYFKERLPTFIFNFFFGEKIRLVETLIKIRARIKTLAEKDPVLNHLVEKLAPEEKSATPRQKLTASN